HAAGPRRHGDVWAASEVGPELVDQAVGNGYGSNGLGVRRGWAWAEQIARLGCWGNNWCWDSNCFESLIPLYSYGHE
ncbi:hypothetical protein Tco_0333802, partial [Tanacetum coccineum]